VSINCHIHHETTHENREDKAFIKGEGSPKAFLNGSNSSCHQHAQKHWEIYQKKCEDTEILVHHLAIPQQVWNKMGKKKEGEPWEKLDNVFNKLTGP